MSFAAELSLEDALALVRVTRAGAEHMLGISAEAREQLELAGVIAFDADDGQAPITSLVGGMFRESCVIGLQAADVAEGARLMAFETSNLVTDFLKKLESEAPENLIDEVVRMFAALGEIFERAAPRIMAPIGTAPREPT